MTLVEQLGNVWRIRDLRRKILITLGLLTLCRVGVYVPVPGVDTKALGDFLRSMGSTAGGQLLGIVNLFSGGAFAKGAIFGLGVMPYISASIIFTLLANVIPSLEALKKEGAAGQKKLNQYTRVATVFICFFQGAIVVRGLFFYPGVIPDYILQDWLYRALFMLSSGFLMMVGTLFLMWLGEQIDEHGIGNGISLIIMVGIIARLPYAFQDLATKLQGAESQQNAILKIILLLALFVAVVVAIVYITRGERRIPVQQQKHVRGPKVYGGQKHYLPLRVNQAGVMPIIFAQALLSFPAIIAISIGKALRDANGFWAKFFTAVGSAVSPQQNEVTFTYVVLYGLLLFFFCYFWTAVMFNPKEMSENLQNYGSFIPGIRPGKRTADYLEGIMNRVTLAGSAFLLAIALMPLLVMSRLGVGWGVAAFYGGTSILIVVGVSLDLVKRVNDHLEMRRYSGFTAGAGGRRRSRRR
jgi:preprotein translocase subunit SecY